MGAVIGHAAAGGVPYTITVATDRLSSARGGAVWRIARFAQSAGRAAFSQWTEVRRVNCLATLT
jgi:hypothetical protein